MENTVTTHAEQGLSWYQNACRKTVFAALRSLKGAGLEVVETFDGASSEQFFGDKDAKVCGQLTILDPSVYPTLIANGSIGASEAYVEGKWDSTDLTQLIQVFVIAQAQLDKLESSANWLSKPKNTLFHKRNKNSKEQAKQNILAHYDLGNELYTRFLDPEMMYSSAIYPNANSGLDEAQLHKLKTICERLDLNSEDRVIEIGTGWGGLAIYAAQNYGCHVTTTTISDAQHEYAEARVKALGLSDKITLLKEDYRNLEGQYDKLVSIEMIEAVGHQYYSSFFGKCNSLLKSGGKMLIQAITIADQRFEHYKNNVDFIQRYIFPGGCLPSIEVMTKHLRKDTEMVLHELHDIGLDYAKTLEDWRVRFNQNWQQISEFGFDERFNRLWNFYLCYCEGAFLQRATSTVHLVARK